MHSDIECSEMHHAHIVCLHFFVCACVCVCDVCVCEFGQIKLVCFVSVCFSCVDWTKPYMPDTLRY